MCPKLLVVQRETRDKVKSIIVKRKHPYLLFESYIKLIILNLYSTV